MYKISCIETVHTSSSSTDDEEEEVQFSGVSHCITASYITFRMKICEAFFFFPNVNTVLLFGYVI